LTTLDYDFSQEKQFSYGNIGIPAAVKHIAKFAADIWQIHPENLLMDPHHDLKNRYLHVDYKSLADSKSVQ
jgi:hypothetical protein